MTLESSNLPSVWSFHLFTLTTRLYNTIHIIALPYLLSQYSHTHSTPLLLTYFTLRLIHIAAGLLSWRLMFLEGLQCKVRLLLANYTHLLNRVCRNEKWTDLFGEIGMIGAGRALVYDIADTAVGFILSLLLTWYSFQSFQIALVMSLLPIVVCLRIIMRQKTRIHECTHDYLKWKRKRWRIVEEMVNNFRCVKLLAMEPVVEKKVLQAREAEIHELMRKDYFVASSNWIWQFLPVLLTGVLLIAWYRRGFSCTTNCFMAFSLIQNFAFPLKTIPKFFSMYSAQRLARRQLSTIKEESIINGCQPMADSTSNDIVDFHVRNASFSFDKIKNQPVLHDISLKIHRGQFVGICGPVASGKSALLQALLGELHCTSQPGSIPSKNSPCTRASQLSISYVSQYPWLLNDSIRNNILLGRKLIPKTYESILRVCGLDSDLRKMIHGDETRTGFHGDSLSGGQQIRVTLARGIYSCTTKRPQALLLDDVFANVDNTMREEMLQKIILGTHKDATRILATHSLELLEKADVIYVLHEGRIHEHGTFDELTKHSTLFTTLLSKKKVTAMSDTQPAELSNQSTLAGTQASTSTENTPSPETTPQSTSAHKYSLLTSVTSLVDTLYYYLSAYSFSQFLIILLSTLVSVTLEHVTSALLSLKMTDPALSMRTIFSFLLISLAQLSFSFLANLKSIRLFNMSAKLIHNQVFESVLHAELSALPLKRGAGEIMNLMTEDTQTLDVEVKEKFLNLMNTLLKAIVNVLIIVYFIPKSVLVLTPVILCYIILPAHIHRQLIHMEKEKKHYISQIISRINEAFSGASIIRAFNAQDWIYNQFETDIRAWQDTEFAFNRMQVWYAFRIHVVAAVLLTCLSWFSAHNHLQYSSIVVMSVLISSCMRLLQSLRDTGIEFQLFIQALHSLRRLKGQKEKLPCEENFGEDMEIEKIDDTPPVLEFENVSMRYAPHLPRVLKDISFRIGGKNCRRVGLIGRSASGKTSVMNCLWKMCSIDSGEIRINSQSIAGVSLRALRKKVLCVVPQHPVLFEGSVRECVDPDAVYSTESAREVLQIVGLSGLDLDARVEASGKNLSVGTKQLLSLARILLHKRQHPKNQFIVFLDEATAFVDKPTVNTIHSILRQHFNDCTIVAISHALEGIVSFCDSVILLHNGRLVLHDTPEKVVRVYQQLEDVQ